MTDSRYSDVKYNPSSATGTKAAILADIANTAKWINTVLPGGVAYDFSLGFGSGDTKYFKFTIAGNSTAPRVSTSAAASIGATKAVLGGNVSADGGATVNDRGIVWATTVDPKTSDNKVSNGNGNGIFSSTVSSLPPGSVIHFRAFATNSTGTSYGSDLTFTTNAALSGTISKTDISCFGSSNGTAEVNITGGSAPYNYSWSPFGGTTSKATGLTQGTYVCTITDSESTQISRSITIAQPDSVVSGTTVVTNVACNGDANGAINMTPAGGTAPYTFNWGGGITTEDRTGLAAGTYTVIITDANGCTATVTETITQPTALSATASQKNIACNGGSTGIATINVLGGTTPYTYSWFPSGGTAATANGLSAGTYTVAVTDANGCTLSRTFTITQAAPVSAPTGASTQTFNNGDTLAVLTVNGQNIKWYATSNDATNHVNQLSANTVITNDTTYYDTQTIGICESKSSLPVKAFNETLGTGTISGESKIMIYPNPVKDILNLSGNEKITKVIIMSIDGKKVSEKMMVGERTINLHSLIQGAYLINIFTDRGVQTIKFIKN
ncbi:Por secretion system C-terminal sorting domain-containing protein [Epilithonimonas mollis]|uniref:Por secretion system C-terminal sorting domain-containing protein n=2 Tax=Epilithonimonas mollis TaxID=216903 RepID=A0A1M6UPR8_9FLAO|nr:Por secretion system C-terminal sorting domain-containing protein [Epilithonimonas mollis]